MPAQDFLALDSCSLLSVLNWALVQKRWTHCFVPRLGLWMFLIHSYDWFFICCRLVSVRAAIFGVILVPVWAVICFLHESGVLSEVAYHGVFPSVDWDGLKLCGRFATYAGRRISGGPHCLVECRGDWKWHWEMWELRSYWKRAAGMCHRCRATTNGRYQCLNSIWNFLFGWQKKSENHFMFCFLCHWYYEVLTLLQFPEHSSPEPSWVLHCRLEPRLVHNKFVFICCSEPLGLHLYCYILQHGIIKKRNRTYICIVDHDPVAGRTMSIQSLWYTASCPRCLSFVLCTCYTLACCISWTVLV